MLPTRRIRGALVIWLAPHVEQHLLGRIACEPTKNFFDLALLSALGSPNEVTSRLPESTVYLKFSPLLNKNIL
jgi:hypothetical protein